MIRSMRTEAATWVSRVALVVFVVFVPPFFRAVIGPGRKRSQLMLAGTLGGISFGLLLARPVSQWLETDASVLCACLGMVLGWTVSWAIARRIPRESN
jgi:hypothetical protein